ncbi:MAG TPA: sigma-70 family RNA polymerase sigma factor [Phycisphaerae bacterium]|jgi:RNA polymerase sigma-70 factor (ECF subfamily)
MNSDNTMNREALLAKARQGSRESLGALLESYRSYLRLLLRAQIAEHLQGRGSDSDVVQETVMEAYRDFRQFRGRTEGELLAWLRRILVHNLARFIERNVTTQKRDVRREVSLERRLGRVEDSSAQLLSALTNGRSSPTAHLRRRERAALLADLLTRLPAHYREVIVLRDLEGLPFEQVAERMQRSAAAARQLYVRALDKLREVVEPEELS